MHPKHEVTKLTYPSRTHPAGVPFTFSLSPHSKCPPWSSSPLRSCLHPAPTLFSPSQHGSRSSLPSHLCINTSNSPTTCQCCSSFGLVRRWGGMCNARFHNRSHPMCWFLLQTGHHGLCQECWIMTGHESLLFTLDEKIKKKVILSLVINMNFYPRRVLKTFGQSSMWSCGSMTKCFGCLLSFGWLD